MRSFAVFGFILAALTAAPLALAPHAIAQTAGESGSFSGVEVHVVGYRADTIKRYSTSNTPVDEIGADKLPAMLPVYNAGSYLVEVGIDGKTYRLERAQLKLDKPLGGIIAVSPASAAIYKSNGQPTGESISKTELAASAASPVEVVSVNGVYIAVAGPRGVVWLRRSDVTFVPLCDKIVSAALDRDNRRTAGAGAGFGGNGLNCVDREKLRS